MKRIDPDIKTHTSVNQFMYVDDHISSYLKLLENPVQGFFNIGGSDYIKIIDLYQKVRNILRNEETINENIDTEVKGIALNTNKAKRILKWSPKFSLDEGIRELINKWTKEGIQKKDILN